MIGFGSGPSQIKIYYFKLIRKKNLDKQSIEAKQWTIMKERDKKTNR